MRKFVYIPLILTALLAAACVSGSSSSGRRGVDVEELPQVEAAVEVFPQLGHTENVESVAFNFYGMYIVSKNDY